MKRAIRSDDIRWDQITFWGGEGIMALSTTELCLAVQAEYGFKKILHWPVCACLNYTEKKKKIKSWKGQKPYDAWKGITWYGCDTHIRVKEVSPSLSRDCTDTGRERERERACSSRKRSSSRIECRMWMKHCSVVAFLQPHASGCWSCGIQSGGAEKLPIFLRIVFFIAAVRFQSCCLKTWMTCFSFISSSVYFTVKKRAGVLNKTKKTV